MGGIVMALVSMKGRKKREKDELQALSRAVNKALRESRTRVVIWLDLAALVKIDKFRASTGTPLSSLLRTWINALTIYDKRFPERVNAVIAEAQKVRGGASLD
jgi:hypothetical protein